MNQQRVVVGGLTAVVFVFVSLAWNYIAGKDMNWDFMNYHFYGAAAMVDNRLGQDYFAASIQSYLNPLPYVPQFLMMRWGWHSLLVGSVLTLIHTLNLLLVWKITRVLVPARHTWSDTMYILVLATALAFVSPVHLTELGTSFADILTSLPILLAVYLLLKSGDQIGLKQLLWPGLLLGFATGAKLTNGALGAAGLVLAMTLLWQSRGFRQLLPGVFCFGLSALVGALLAHGYWSYLLWQEFGNPIFPLFNSLIASPDFMQASYQDRRFMGEGWWGLMKLPFTMTQLAPWIYTENISVDIRFAALLLSLAVIMVLFASRRATGWPIALQRPLKREWMPVLWLALFFLVAYLVWGNAFRIGRYAYVVWVLLGPLLAGLLVVAFNANVARMGLLVVAIVQVFVLYTAGTPRWMPSEWDKKWVNVAVPQELEQKPHTVLTVGTLSYSVFIPFLHPESSAINIAGQYNQPVGERMTARMKYHLAKPVDTLRVVYRDASKSLQMSQPVGRTRQDLDAMLSLYGLRTDNSDCQSITVTFTYLEGTVLSEAPPREATAEPILSGDRLVACRVTRLPQKEHAEALRQLAAVDAMFDKIEAACGRKLSPHGVQTLRGVNGWLRNYINSLNSVATDENIVFIRPFRSMVDFDLGQAKAWLAQDLDKTPLCPDLPKSMQIN